MLTHHDSTDDLELDEGITKILRKYINKIRKEVKKGGAGKGNWGGAENEENTTAPVVESEPVVVEATIVETEEEKAQREAEEKKREEERQKEERVSLNCDKIPT